MMQQNVSAQVGSKRDRDLCRDGIQRGAGVGMHGNSKLTDRQRGPPITPEHQLCRCHPTL